MNTKKLIWPFILLLILMFFAACSDDNNKRNNNLSIGDENVSKEDMPIVEEAITLDILGGQDINPADDWNDILVFNEYEKMTNINVNFELIPADSIPEKKNLRLGSGELPDAFYNMGLSQKDLKKYGEQGIFIKLNDLIENYAPNLNALF